jgi:regulator of cell morphogenesis and NO signaling
MNEAVATATVEKDWTKEKLSALIAHILTTHHDYLKKQLPEIAALFQQAFDNHKDSSPCDRILFFHQSFSALAEELQAHLQKEEMILFPFIEGYERSAEQRIPLAPPPFGSVAHPIAVMESDHEEVLQVLDAMRDRSGNYTPLMHAGPLGKAVHSKLKELDEDLRQHIYLENTILHPRAKHLEEANRGW